MIKTINTLLLVDIVIVIICWVVGERLWLFNTQIAFWSSALVVSASLLSYRRMVNQGLASGAGDTGDDRDLLDKLDDPHHLYDDTEESDASKDMREVITEEKQRMKRERRSVTETIRDSRAFLSFYRLGAYVILVLGFFYLNGKGLLHIPSYLAALFVPIAVVISTLLSQKGKA